VDIRTVVTAILLAVGCFLMVVACIGMVRFPDFYARCHPSGKGDTLGQMLVLVGLIIYEGFSLVSVKLLIIIAFIWIANPTATHWVMKAAYTAGLKPWQKSQSS